MVLSSALRINVALGLVACAESPIPRAPLPPATETRVELSADLLPGEHGLVTPRSLPAGRLSELPRGSTELPRSYLDDSTSILFELGASLEDAELEQEGGEAIDEALEDFSTRQIANYGVGLLTAVQLFGDVFHEPICEPPELRVEVEHDGEPWELALSVPQYVPFVGDLEPVMGELSEGCAEGLLLAAGDLEAAIDARDCSEDEQHQFFEEGSACLECVEGNGGDYALCVESEACPEEAPVETWVMEDGEKAWYDLISAVALACRPEWLAPAYILANVDDDGTLPESYDHANWNYYCFLIYIPDSEDVGYVCDAGDGPTTGHALSEGIVGRTLWMKDKDGDLAHQAREYFTPEVTLSSGERLRWSWANSSNMGRISKPYTIDDQNGDGVVDVSDPGFGYPSASWGLNPHALRPDGTDPSRLDDTFARDWLAVIALKTATTKDGISILTSNHSRCLSWEPDTGGAYRCVDMGPPEEGWHNDALHYGYTMDDGQTYSYPVPITTIGSTGLPDPDIPGGIVPLIAGSQRLAEPGWEDCTWPESFVADQAPYPDQAWDYEGPANLWGDTYRFGKDPGLDLRVVLNTTIPRHYCPEEDE